MVRKKLVLNACGVKSLGGVKLFVEAFELLVESGAEYGQSFNVIGIGDSRTYRVFDNSDTRHDVNTLTPGNGGSTRTN